MNLQPLSNRVLAEIQEVTKSEGGLFLPQMIESDSTTKQAIVLAVGPGQQGPPSHGCSIIPMTVKVGDLILIPKYSGISYGDNLLILKEDEILGIMNEKKEVCHSN